MYSIYCITCLINNKKYVGYTSTSIEKRLKRHFYDSSRDCPRRGNYPILNAIRKYKQDNFIIKTLEEFDNKELALLSEKKWIKELKTQDNTIGYNIADGGQLGGWHSLTKEQRSAKLKEMHARFTPEQRSKIAQDRWKKKSPEQVKKDLDRLQKGSLNRYKNMSLAKAQQSYCRPG